MLAQFSWAEGVAAFERGMADVVQFLESGAPLKHAPSALSFVGAGGLPLAQEAVPLAQEALGATEGRECDQPPPGRSLAEGESETSGAEGVSETSEAWHAEWRHRFECWFLGLPLPTQAQLGDCLGALALHLGGRLEAALSIPSSSQSPQSSEPGCELVETEALQLPHFPSLGALDWKLPPLPRLLPAWQQLHGAAGGLSAGGVAAGGLAAASSAAELGTAQHPVQLQQHQQPKHASVSVLSTSMGVAVSMGVGVALAFSFIFALAARQRRIAASRRDLLAATSR